jgi:hypothetical protein
VIADKVGLLIFLGQALFGMTELHASPKIFPAAAIPVLLAVGLITWGLAERQGSAARRDSQTVNQTTTAFAGGTRTSNMKQIFRFSWLGRGGRTILPQLREKLKEDGLVNSATLAGEMGASNMERIFRFSWLGRGGRTILPRLRVKMKEEQVPNAENSVYNMYGAMPGPLSPPQLAV